MRTFALISALFLWCASAAFSPYAQQNNNLADDNDSPIHALGTEYENSIELLQNRFRVDHNVDEVTLVFFREYGSAPVVLVKPDGSKIFQSHGDNENPENAKILWYDDTTYDMVKIRNPVAGPWQAVGQILPGSRVMVVSDIELHAESLPEILFVGEILKHTASLTNDGKPVQYAEFRDAVNLTIELISTDNPNYDNFNATNQVVATFQDNGMGMDEVPLDGIFTGQFNLNITAGEWTPVFRVSTPMYTREQVGEKIVLHASPIIQTVEFDDGKRGYHTLLIDVDPELVVLESLLVDGKIRFPNGDIQNFSLTEPSGEARQQRIIAFENGEFKVKLTAYGQTVSGRDFILDVPEYSFTVNPPEPAAPAEPIAAQKAAEAAEMNIKPQPPVETPSQEKEEMATSTLVSLLLAVNGSILAIGAAVIGIIIWRRNHPSRVVMPASAPTTPATTTKKFSPRSWWGSFTALFKKKPKSNTAKGTTEKE